MFFKAYYFRFSFLGTLLALIGFSVFCSLGYWQVTRANYKLMLQQTVEERKQEPPIVLQQDNKNIEGYVYTPVVAIGVYDKANEILIDNQKHQGLPGYHVLTPLKLKFDDSVIIINRGWIPMGHNRDDLPELDSSEGEVEVQGVLSLHRSPPVIKLGHSIIDTENRWLYFDIEQYNQVTGYKILPVQILIDQNNRDAYEVNWPDFDAKVTMHIGYSIMWFAFAIIVVVTYFGVNIRKMQDDIE